jgi:hypothetical protein
MVRQMHGYPLILIQGACLEDGVCVFSGGLPKDLSRLSDNV